MKVTVNSIWDSNKRKPNIYFYLDPENEIERALLRSLYGVRPKFIARTDGRHMIDFYPDGA